MGKKSKIITAVFSLCLIAFGVVFAMTNIISATQARANSSFTVTFTALSVDTDISAKYYIKSNPSGVSLHINNSEATTISLNVNNTTGSMTGASETLSVSNFYVIYEFSFRNKDTQHVMNVSATRTSANDSNIKVFYLVDANNSGTAITDLSKLEAKRALLEPANENNQIITPPSFNISANTTGKLYMMVRVDSWATDAVFHIGNLAFTLSRVA